MTSQPTTRAQTLRVLLMRMAKCWWSMSPLGMRFDPRLRVGPAGALPAVGGLILGGCLLQQGAAGLGLSTMLAGLIFASLEIAVGRRRKRARAERQATHRAAWNATLNAPIDGPDDA